MKERLGARVRDMELKVQGVRLSVRAIVLGRIVDCIDIVMGMDTISQLGGVMIAFGNKPVMFGKVLCLTTRSEVAPCAVTVGLEGKLEKISEGRKSGLQGQLLTKGSELGPTNRWVRA